MNIGIKVLSNQESHNVRGVGSYVRLLKDNLSKFDKNNSYFFFDKFEELIKEKIDLIHFPYFDPFFITLPKKKKYKTVVTVHDLIPLLFPDNFPSGIKGKLRWYSQKKSLKDSDAVITDSFSSKKDIVRILNLKSEIVNVVYLSISDNFRVLENSKLNRLKEKFNLPQKFVVYVGDATWNKNLPNLVKAIKQTGLPLVMVGKVLAEKEFDKKNKWNKDLLTVFEETKIDKRFLKVGFVSEEDLIGIYNLALFLILPSVYEGFGLPVLEAMACGCPVITTRKGSLEEIAGSAAYYIDPESTDDIKIGIEKLENSQGLRNELSKKGIDQAKKFSLEKTIKETVRVYETLL